MARQQPHAINVRYVPTGEDVAPRPRIVPKRIDQRRDLVVPLLGAAEKPVDRRFVARPVDPPMAIDRTQIAPLGGKIAFGDDPRLDILGAARLAHRAETFVERPDGPELDA